MRVMFLHTWSKWILRTQLYNLSNYELINWKICQNYETVFTYFLFYKIQTCLYFAILMYYIYALGAEPLRSLEMTEIYIPK